MTTALDHYAIPTENDVVFEVISQETPVVLRADSGAEAVDVFLDPVSHHRLATHLARALGYGTLARDFPTVAWTLATRDGLWIGSRGDNDTWWAVSAEDPSKRAVFGEAEELWPLTRSPQRYFWGDGMCLYEGGEKPVLAHRHAGWTYTEYGYSDRSTHVTHQVQHLTLPPVSQCLPQQELGHLDLDASGDRVLVRPMGLALATSGGSASVVLGRVALSLLLRALVETLPVPGWVLR